MVGPKRHGPDDQSKDKVPGGHAEDLRLRCEAFLGTNAFDCGLAFCICCSILLVVWMTDAGAEEEDTPTWIYVLMMILNCVYVTETGLQVFAFSAREYYSDAWNVMDTIIIIVDFVLTTCDLAGTDWPLLSFLRMFRFLKLARAYKTLQKFPELHLMMKGLASALRSMFWGVIVTTVVTLGWSILATQVLHPINKEIADSGAYGNCDRCGRAFSSVFQSFITFMQQLVAGDSWGTVSVPIIEHSPMTVILFGAVLVSIQLVILNMILAAVCDAATQAREGNDRDQAARKRHLAESGKKQLMIICEDLDKDGDGRLCLEEVLEGAKFNPAFIDTLALMDVKDDDLLVIFQILDSDKSGDIDYEEFVDQLYSMRDKNLCTMLCFIKHYVVEVKKKVLQEVEVIQAMHVDILSHISQDQSRPNIEALEDTDTHDAHEVLKRPLQQTGCELQKLPLEELTATVRREIQDVQSKCDDSLAMLKDIHQSLLSVVSATTNVEHSLAVNVSTSLELCRTAPTVRRLSNDVTDARKLAQTSLEGVLESDPQCTSLARRAACCAMKNASPVAVKPPESYLSESAV